MVEKSDAGLARLVIALFLQQRVYEKVQQSQSGKIISV